MTERQPNRQMRKADARLDVGPEQLFLLTWGLAAESQRSRHLRMRPREGDGPAAAEAPDHVAAVGWCGENAGVGAAVRVQR